MRLTSKSAPGKYRSCLLPPSKESSTHFAMSKPYFSKVFLRRENKEAPVPDVDLREIGAAPRHVRHVHNAKQWSIAKHLVSISVVSISTENMPTDFTSSAIDSWMKSRMIWRIVVVMSWLKKATSFPGQKRPWERGCEKGYRGPTAHSYHLLFHIFGVLKVSCLLLQPSCQCAPSGDYQIPQQV